MSKNALITGIAFRKSWTYTRLKVGLIFAKANAAVGRLIFILGLPVRSFFPVYLTTVEYSLATNGWPNGCCRLFTLKWPSIDSQSVVRYMSVFSVKSPPATLGDFRLLRSLHRDRPGGRRSHHQPRGLQRLHLHRQSSIPLFLHWRQQLPMVSASL